MGALRSEQDNPSLEVDVWPWESTRAGLAITGLSPNVYPPDWGVAKLYNNGTAFAQLNSEPKFEQLKDPAQRDSTAALRACECCLTAPILGNPPLLFIV